MNVSFLGKGSEAAALRLAEMLKSSQLDETVVITAVSSAHEADVLAVLAPPESKRKIKCGMLIAPAGMELPNAVCDRKLSCGMSRDDDVTMSSVCDGDCVASMRRELKTLSGGIIDRSEICVKKGKRLSPEALLAVVGCALMLDVPPDKMH